MEATVAIAEKQRKLPTQPRLVSLDDYFKAEEKSQTKHEYHAGTIVPFMAGAMYPHNQLAIRANAMVELFVEELDLDFTTNNSDIKIRIEEYNKIVYPDGIVICGDPHFYKGRRDTITNPIVVIEVLSKSTKKFDETTKFDWYRSLPSFKEYVLMSQERQQVSVYSKQEDGSWTLRDYIGEDATAILHAVQNCPLSLKRLYRKLKR